MKKDPLSPLHVIHLGKYYPPAMGGIETHTQTLAQGQAKLGARVQVAVVNHATPDGRDVTFDRWAKTRACTWADGPVTVHRFGRIASVAKFDIVPDVLSQLRRLAQHHTPDVWHLHAPNITMMFALLAMPSLRPLVITHHSDIVRQKILLHAVRPIERLVYGRAARILSTSEEYIDGSSILSRFRSRVRALPLGTELDSLVNPPVSVHTRAAALREQYPGPIWVSVGRLVYYKALEVALESLVRVPGTFIIAGTGPMESAWRTRAEQLGVARRVVWAGRISDEERTALYYAATAFWFPSNARAEGFGLSQVEAMACGCPVVNTKIPYSGVASVSRDSVTGFTVPINDPAAFTARANLLAADQPLRDRLGAAALRRAIQEFSAETMAARSLELYREIVAEPRHAGGTA